MKAQMMRLIGRAIKGKNKKKENSQSPDDLV
jgi:hypothetical protein